ncbi:amidohydrolase [Candidatus Bathyarchaeota archaeon]|nr:amidohydrolase [Candidatus Bathyarchaeota archaeon]
MVDAKKTALKWIDNNHKRIIEVSDEIWGYAELGLLEYKSAKLLIDELIKHGFNVEEGVGGMPTAFVATWGEGKPVIGVMGEYDALQGLSQSKKPVKDPIVQDAPGHGCGHNIHGASGMAGAIAMRYAMEKNGIKGTVKFYGTPAEESGSGKVWMVRDGVFDGVDAVLSHHPGSMNVASLASSLANNSVKFHFKGKTSHAAGSPEMGRSALDAVELMNVGVNFLREHIIQEARVHYVIEEGGGQPNVVPDYARSWYLVRAPQRDQVEHIYDRVLKIANGAAMMTETELEVEFIKAIYNKIPSKVLSEVVTRNLREIGAPQYTDEELEFAKKLVSTVSREAKIETLRKSKRPEWEKLIDTVMDTSIPDAWNDGIVSAGSTDVSDVSWMAPTMEFGTSTWPLGTPGHSWMNVAGGAHCIGHKSLIYASKVIAASGLDMMMDPALREAAWKEQKERTMGKEYKTPIPEGMTPPLNMWEK